MLEATKSPLAVNEGAEDEVRGGTTTSANDSTLQKASRKGKGPRSGNTVITEAIQQKLGQLGDQLMEIPLSDLYDQILMAINAEIDTENKLAKMNDWPVKRISQLGALDELSTVRVMLARYDIAVIDLAEGRGGADMALLALYNHDTGLWETGESDLVKLIQTFNSALTHRACDSLLKTMQAHAPLKTRTVDAHLVPMNNGIVDTSTEPNSLIPFGPEYVFLSKSPIDFNPDAEEQVLTEPDGNQWTFSEWIESLSDDEGVPQLLWEGISATLRPGVHFDQALFLHSSKGNNGKGTYCSVLRNLVGPDGHTSIPLAKFGDQFAKAGLITARNIITDENPVGAFSKDLGDFKAIVTGDEFTLERKYRDPISISFNGQVVQCVNDFPKTKDKSASIARRQVFIPFRKWFGGDEKKYIKHDFLKRKEVLEWVAKEALAMDCTEFSNPPACQELLERFQRENSPVRDFWAEMADEFVWDFVPLPFLWDLFTEWFKQNNPSGTQISRNEFKNQLEEIVWSDADWDYKGPEQKVKPGQRMSAAEPLILDFDLQEWMTPGKEGGPGRKPIWGPETCCRPKLKPNYRGGIIRVGGETGDGSAAAPESAPKTPTSWEPIEANSSS